jgi:hypothetical protein
MELICYVRNGDKEFRIVPAPPRREWMDAFHQRAPYRCLPLAIANRYGWEILSPTSFTAIWNGGPAIDGIVILPDTDAEPPVASHFGGGILTFRMPYIFRTDPGTDIIVQGPINQPKDAIAPLTGIIEADWGPFSFTMNWKFTRAKTAVHFRKGEPICNISLARRGALEEVRPKMMPLSANTELETEHREWLASRAKFNEDLHVKGSEAQRQGWQKHYQQGVDLHGNEKPFLHLTKMNLHPFEWVDK